MGIDQPLLNNIPEGEPEGVDQYLGKPLTENFEPDMDYFTKLADHELEMKAKVRFMGDNHAT